MLLMILEIIKQETEVFIVWLCSQILMDQNILSLLEVMKKQLP
jgi:hypothetical protein